jgi:methylated-DNA-[protein]-cysteine S-methyltransferase
MAVKFATVGTPIGRLTIVTSDRGVVATFFEDQDVGAGLESLERALDEGIRRSARLGTVERDVRRYFDGTASAFETPVDLTLAGDGFGRRVLEVTAGIPYGEMWTYGDVADAAGSPRAGRAAGNALARCPIELFVPCHRVVHSSGTIGGYGRHEERKRWLLAHEGHI